MEVQSGVTQSIMDELHSSEIQFNQMEGEIGATRSIIDEFHSWNIKEGSNGRGK